MELIFNPDRKYWSRFIERPYSDSSGVRTVVTEILNAVKDRGDEALLHYSRKFGSPSLDSLQVTKEEIEAADTQLDEALKDAIRQAHKNISTFHQLQLVEEPRVRVAEGIECWRKNIPIDRVGLYIPGGTAPLFSTVIMLGVPAQIAGCSEIILCTPADTEGKIHPAILFAASICGITKLYKLGGAQAIGALACGTETVPWVYKIFGPGNQYVTEAKQQVQQWGIAIDMPAGPSEVLVLADDSADPSHVASDLLSQAEHGTDSQSILVTTSSEFSRLVLNEIETQKQTLSRKDIVEASLIKSKVLVFNKETEAMDFVNAYAPEHLIINSIREEFYLSQVRNAGSVFIGPYSPEAAGDYASGTNHTLPTNGFARAYSGVSVDSFLKKVTFQKLSRAGLESIAETVISMAEAEGLDAHAQAIRYRLSLNEKNGI